MCRKNKNLHHGFILLIVISLAQLACEANIFNFGPSADRASEDIATQLAIKRASLVPSLAETQSPPDPLIFPETTPLPEDSPQITFNVTAENIMDLPVYRSNISNPINVDNKSIAPWPASMHAERVDDLQKLGSVQPGTVRQTTTFEGTYDPTTGKLTGTLTHQFFTNAQGTTDYLAATTDYRLTCALDVQRMGSSNILEGVCTGQSTEEYKVPGNSDYNRTEKISVIFTISGNLADELLEGS